MPRLERMTAARAETLLLQTGFVLPFHAGKDLHPKIIKQVLLAIEDA